MAHYDIFRHHLAIKFPAFGHALWDPSPGNLYPPVEVGDVGYICEGKFHRLFNVLLPADHPSHQNFGVPEYHEQLTPDVADHIHICNLSPNHFCSAKVTSMPVSERLARGPDEIPKVSFSCPTKEGAVLSLPVQAKGKDTVAKSKFGKWLVRHIDCWFAWARQLDLGVNRMEDIILVTGMHRTRSWTNVAFPGGQEGAQASFGAKADQGGDVVAINWQFSHEYNRGVVLNRGPDGVNLPEDQCIFIRGFRATRLFGILPTRFKAAAGPNPDPEGYDDGSDAELMPIPAVSEYRDPLHILIEYIAEALLGKFRRVMVLVHDEDLERLHGVYDSTPPDTLQQDVVLGKIRSLKPKLSYTPTWSGIDLKDRSSAGSSAIAGTEPVWVVTLSTLSEKQLNFDSPERPPAGGSKGGSVKRDYSGQPATLSPPSQTFERTQDSTSTPDPGPQSTPLSGIIGGGYGPFHVLPRVRTCRFPGCNLPMFFDRRFHEYWEWCSPQHVQEGLARGMEKVCKDCKVWPRRYGSRYCGGDACNKKDIPLDIPM